MSSKLVAVIENGQVRPVGEDGTVLLDWREHRSSNELRYDLADASSAQLAAAMTSLAAERNADARIRRHSRSHLRYRSRPEDGALQAAFSRHTLIAD